MTLINTWYSLSLDEYLASHESLEAHTIEARLHSGQLLFISAQNCCFNELFRLFVAVPQLEEVDYGDVVSLHAIVRLETMALESIKFGRVSHACPSTSISNCVVEVFWVDLELGLNAKQDRIVHNVDAGKEVWVSSNWLDQSIDVSSRHVDLWHVLLVHDEVLIFQGWRVTSSTLD